MEGIPPRDVRYQGKIGIPVVLLCSSGTWPYAKENYFSLIDNRSAPVTMIELVDFGHNSVTDDPFIFPGDYNYRIDPTEGLQAIRKISVEYFNRVFRQEGSFIQVLETNPSIKYTTYK